jgi:hypothetical protein
MNTSPTPSPKTVSKISRPSEVNKLFTSFIFAALLATCAYFLFVTSVTRSAYYIPGVLTLATFALSFLFTSVFQVVRKCPFNPVSISIASGSIAIFILFIIGLLSFSWTGGFLTWIVTSAFPYVQDSTVVEDPTQYSLKDKHDYSHAYAYWMFWGGVLPMYTFLGFIGSC